VIWITVLSLGVVIVGLIVLFGSLEETMKEITFPLRHDDIIRQQAREKHLDPALIAAVIYGESKFQQRTSEVGAVGLMQILPATADFVA